MRYTQVVDIFCIVVDIYFTIRSCLRLMALYYEVRKYYICDVRCIICNL